MKVKLDIKNKEAVIEWLNRVKQGSDDARPLWQAVTPKIEKEFIEMGQFSPYTNTGKGWKHLTAKYIRWKSKVGYPNVTGIMTGKLRFAAGRDALVKQKPKYMTIRVNEKLVRNAKGEQYAHYFNALRPVYKTVPKRINSFLSFDVKKFSDGRTHNSFTYLWLRNALEPK